MSVITAALITAISLLEILNMSSLETPLSPERPTADLASTSPMLIHGREVFVPDGCDVSGGPCFHHPAV